MMANTFRPHRSNTPHAMAEPPTLWARNGTDGMAGMRRPRRRRVGAIGADSPVLPFIGAYTGVWPGITAVVSISDDICVPLSVDGRLAPGLAQSVEYFHGADGPVQRAELGAVGFVDQSERALAVIVLPGVGPTIGQFVLTEVKHTRPGPRRLCMTCVI